MEGENSPISDIKKKHSLDKYLILTAIALRIMAIIITIKLKRAIFCALFITFTLFELEIAFVM